MITTKQTARGEYLIELDAVDTAVVKAAQRIWRDIAAEEEKLRAQGANCIFQCDSTGETRQSLGPIGECER
jgi:hypothetical protein